MTNSIFFVDGDRFLFEIAKHERFLVDKMPVQKTNLPFFVMHSVRDY